MEGARGPIIFPRGWLQALFFPESAGREPYVQLTKLLISELLLRHALFLARSVSVSRARSGPSPRKAYKPDKCAPDGYMGNIARGGQMDSLYIHLSRALALSRCDEEKLNARVPDG